MFPTLKILYCFVSQITLRYERRGGADDDEDVPI